MKIHKISRTPTLLAFCGVLLLLWPMARAGQGLEMPNIFGDHMVLQRDQPIRLWGWAGQGHGITVAFAGQTHTATPGADGRWAVTLNALPAESSGRVLTVKSAASTLRFQNVLIGDVWLCGGQSNMEWRLRSTRDADVEIPSANYPGIRFIRIKPEGTAEPRDNFPAEKSDGTWLPCSPETIGDCSGVAYFFGQRLHRRLDVPVGLVNAAWGGTMAQHWVTRPTLESLPAAKPSLEKYEQKCRAGSRGEGRRAPTDGSPSTRRSGKRSPGSPERRARRIRRANPTRGVISIRLKAVSRPGPSMP